MGVPVFSTPLDANGAPKKEGWQNTRPDERQISRWRPGMGLGVLTGSLFDILDVDPRNGGEQSLRQMLGLLGDNAPDYFLKVRTPSGGWHFYIAPLGLGKHAGFLPGLDLLGDKAFAFLPPTVRKGGSYVAEKVVPGLSGLYDAEPCEPLRDLVAARLAEREVAGTELGSNRPEIEALKDAVLNANDGFQYGALLSLTHEWQKRYEQDVVKELLRSFLPLVPLIDKNDPWYPAKGKRRADFWVNHFMHKKGRIIPDATAREARVLDRIKPQRDTSRYLAGIYNGDWLDKQEFAPLQFAIPNLVPAGLVICAGAPFSGKSILVLRMGLEVARGGTLFGVRCTKRSVLYLALEDGVNRMQKRARELLGDSGAIPRAFHGGHDIAPGHLPDTVRAWLNRPGNSDGMVLVDVLGRVMDKPERGETTYDRDYRVLGGLKAICSEYPSAALLVNHHTRKAGANTDYLETVSGTNAITGAADTVLVIERKRDDKEGVLKVVSRDIDPAEYAMTLDRPMGWTMPGDSLDSAAELAAIRPRRTASLSEKTIAIVELVCANPNGISAEDVASEVDVTIADARNRLKRSTDKGEIRRIRLGIYGPPRKAKIAADDN